MTGRELSVWVVDDDASVRWVLDRAIVSRSNEEVMGRAACGREQVVHVGFAIGNRDDRAVAGQRVLGRVERGQPALAFFV